MKDFLQNFFSSKKRVLVFIATICSVLLLVVVFLRNAPPPPPREALFSVAYDEEDQKYVVRLKTTDSPTIQKEVALWFKENKIDFQKEKIRYLTLKNQGLQQKIARSLPFDGPDFSIQYFPKADIFLVQAKLTDKTFPIIQAEALAWFKEKGVNDFSKIKIRWLKEGPGMKDEPL